MSNYTGYATYNICKDQFQVFIEQRLETADYERARAAKLQFWHGSKCWAGKWSTQAEDFILSLGFEIEDNDQADDVEARAERFTRYAERSAESADNAAEYLDTRANTERRKRLALSRLANETEKAEYWNERVAASIRHAAYKERPDVIYRRIQGLEKDERKHTKEMNDAEKNQIFRYAEFRRKPDGSTGAFIDPEKKAQAIIEAEPIKEHHRRWLEHAQLLLSYQRELYKQSGGIASDKTVIQVGGAAMVRGKFYEVKKLNKATFEYEDPYCHWRKFWKAKYAEVSEILTPAEWQARQPRPETEAETAQAIDALDKADEEKATAVQFSLFAEVCHA